MTSPWVINTLSVLLFVTSLFMILLVLIQRGRGGGLAGAFGGMGGQSAFGTRAGDVFTKITVVVAIVFILLASLLGKAMRGHQEDVDSGIAGNFGGGAKVESVESAADDEAAPSMKAVEEDDSSEDGDGATSDTPSGDNAAEQPDDSTPPATGETKTTQPADAEPTEPVPDDKTPETPIEDSTTE